MAQESFQEKTEQATPKRLEEARKKGQVAKSRELASAAVLLSSLFTLYWGSGFFMTHLCRTLSYYLYHLSTMNIGVNTIQSVVLLGMKQFFILLGPLFLVITFIALLSNYLQVGALFTWEPIIPKFSKISPMEGLKRLLSLQSLMEFVKSLFKLIVVTWIAWSTVRNQAELLPPLLDETPYQIISCIGMVSFEIFWKSCLAMILLSILDYMYQRWDFAKNLKMTKQEVKEEYKQTEGDPQLKSRIRSIQREIARKRIMQEVPEADVVIISPARLAVALKYIAGTMDAPYVLAKGAGVISERIRQIARENAIPVVENKPLAHSLYKLVEIGQTIPENLFQAVSDIFAYVYRMKGKGRRS